MLAADWSGEGYECFDAEYGVRVVSAAGEVELHYCFWCRNVAVHGPAGNEGIHPFAGGPGRLVKSLARKLGVVRRPWWRFWGRGTSDRETGRALTAAARLPVTRRRPAGRPPA